MSNYLQDRARGRLIPGTALPKTRSLGTTGEDLDTSVLFPDRSELVTFDIGLKPTGASPLGIVFTLGDSAAGLAAWVLGQDLGIAVGTGTGDKGFLLTYKDVFVSAGILTVSVYTSKSLVAVKYGEFSMIAAIGNDSFDPIGWSNDSPGAIGKIPSGGSVNARVPAGAKFAISDLEIVRDLSVYDKQVPNSLYTSILTTEPLSNEFENIPL